MINFDIITIFPHILDSYTNESILGRAQKKKLIKIQTHNLRDATKDRHKTVDDKPYGGGPGMVMMVEPIYKMLKKIVGASLADAQSIRATVKVAPTKRGEKKIKIILLDPKGKQFNQKMAKDFSKLDQLVLVCGRYEGIDARVEKFTDEKVSVGPYILSGGELGAGVILEAVSRLIPGVLGNQESLNEETFNNKLLEIENWKLEIDKEYPQYTRPEIFEYKEKGKKKNLKVPNVLLSGNHGEIKNWRKKHS
ncbi:MAG: tRNA (guanosine(37)-N1)-methyltransferase TrmD [Candidatus Kuenenbacteria bacterium]